MDGFGFAGTDAVEVKTYYWIALGAFVIVAPFPAVKENDVCVELTDGEVRFWAARGDIHASRPTANDGHGQDALWRLRPWARATAPGIGKCAAQAQRLVQAPEGVEVVLQQRPRHGCDTSRV